MLRDDLFAGHLRQSQHRFAPPAKPDKGNTALGVAMCRGQSEHFTIERNGSFEVGYVDVRFKEGPDHGESYGRGMVYAPTFAGRRMV